MMCYRWSMALTNKQIGDMIGVSDSMASRLCSGERLPSAETLSNIVVQFGIDANRAIEAYQKGMEYFGPWFVRELDQWDRNRAIPFDGPDDPPGLPDTRPV